ncbi:hypothetical protein P168DRAFT_326065 [Aspergillus campestris IBT 28561]|uniref:MARVEL domain-containing protein n=1 Tax=Aspergillus campestris (strain IBT 28561) TaxID=1392248 RepID=A0A2I1D7A0_ASPC2|nr:uncharacterized protein P168DRAFT_326065 [Aspergillus campestris IBT 28561]PKY05739.1 hypothetical protein P168DRAFT_326065 [Aspergillus campestris IBT 28561]
MFPSSLTKPFQLLCRAMQWSSAAIVLGLTSYYIHKGPRGLLLKYTEVIATMSIVFFLPAFVSPFMPNRLSKYVLLIDVVFSYLWLTAFIFAAQDYNRDDCFLNAPPHHSCAKKKANESFIFLTFIFTFFAMFLEVLNLWADRRENRSPSREKYSGGAHGGPPDAPLGSSNV